MILMTSAFVLINSEIGTEEKVKTALESIDSVKDACLVYGVYDIIISITAPSMDELKSIILNQIRDVAHIRSTLTLIVAERTKE